MTDIAQTTTEKNITQRLQALIAEAIQVDLEQVPPDLGFGELPQWDSMGHMEVMLRLEEQFGIEINADTIAALISIPVIRDYLEKNGHERQAN